MYAAIHRCRNIRLQTTYKDNCNSVSLEFEAEDGTFILTIYDLPDEVTDKLETLRDDNTEDYDDEIKD